MQSAGIGLIYSNVIVMSTKWIPKYRGVITGLIVALDSVSTFLVMQIQTMYFNPNNLEANTDGQVLECCFEPSLIHSSQIFH